MCFVMQTAVFHAFFNSMDRNNQSVCQFLNESKNEKKLALKNKYQST